ncbi:DUF1272 domain-containing protein [Ochrovirga pacifica]|uniref:DUF1272 domain-containing protein n=1 Tax=Ochrovirga pacifica TaxID=1042376 RepID=UPI0002558B2B|nr:DUF1272 domain-containing protein [Ochrovirga pacifica]
MLQIRTTCEHCEKELPYNSTQARICSYECTFCKDCVEQLLHNVCPNCGGGFQPRPIRPKANLLKHPVKKEKIHKPVIHNKYLAKNKNKLPENR